MTLLMTAADIKRSLDRLACEVLERIPDHESLVLIGIQRRGVDLAVRLAESLAARLSGPPLLGELDINLYRDDWTTLSATPHINATHIDFSLEDKSVVLVDDVLFTGRTIRCALEALPDFGRPKLVALLVLIDRGHRELPIQADFIGKVIATTKDQRVDVHLEERDGQDQVVLT